MTEIESLQFCNDKRNRNPNWTDEEIIRFLELLQEEDVMKDLLAQRNRQVSSGFNSAGFFRQAVLNLL
jgi:hypothetical protein